MSYLILDLETTIKASYKRKANPFDPDNWVVMRGHKYKGDAKPTGHRYPTREASKADCALAHLLNDSIQLVVGANIKFDLLHLLQEERNLDAWMTYVARGGNIWDVQLAEYLLDGCVQQSHMLSLDDMALRYGFDQKVDEVKLLWEAGVDTPDIDPALLSRYLLGEDLVDPVTKQPTGRRREGDIGVTEQIFLKQLARARQTGQIKSILMNMGSLIASTEMERNGMFANKALGLELAAATEVKLTAALARLKEYLPADLPFDFNWTSRHQLSPLIFGGTVKYQARVWHMKDGTEVLCSGRPTPDALNAYVQKDEVHYVLEDGTTMGTLWYEHVLGTEWQGSAPEGKERVTFKGGKNAGEFKTKKVKVDDTTNPKGAARDFYYTFPRITDPDDSWKSSDEGLWSVASEVIEALGNRNIPFLKDLKAVKGMEKDLGTYFIKWSESKQENVGMLTLIQPSGLIHHGLNHTSTVTGRFSSSNPNLQNIPTGNKSDAKQVFESRFDGGFIGQSDFSSLEIYVQAILTHCATLIADLKAGIDLHCMRLALKEHMEYGEVFALCKGDKFDQEWDYKRTGAKNFSFQRAYGAGAKAIALSTGMAIEEVEALIEAEEKRYPEIKTYFEKRTLEIKAARRPTDRRIPHPNFPAVICQLGVARVQTPDNKVYSYLESPSLEFMAKRGEFTSFSPTEIKNYEVQGEGGEWMKAAMWLMVREWYARRNFEGLSLLVNSVHDAAYSDSHAKVYKQAGALMHACMLAASDFMEWYFGWKLPLPVPSDTVWGKSMAEENKFEGADYMVIVNEERTALRRKYMGGYTPSYLN